MIKAEYGTEMLTTVVFYKKLTGFIEALLRTRSHPLCFMKRVFIEYFEKTYLNYKSFTIIGKVMSDVNKFIEFLLEIISIYLDLDLIYERFCSLGGGEPNFLT